MSAIREFYGGTFLNIDGLENGVYNNKVELKYYKLINSPNACNNKKTKFGIEVVKKCVANNIVTEEKKEIFNCIENEDTAEKVLELLKINKVSPINVLDVLQDLSYKKRRLYIK